MRFLVIAVEKELTTMRPEVARDKGQVQTKEREREGGENWAIIYGLCGINGARVFSARVVSCRTEIACGGYQRNITIVRISRGYLPRRTTRRERVYTWQVDTLLRRAAF